MDSQIYKVLIVDDDRFLLNMYTIKFKKAGIEISTAGSAAEALNKLRAGSEPDALIVDIVMPSMDGFELLETIRREKLSPRSLVIFFTNLGQSPDIERARRLGVVSYIVKASSIPSEVVERVIEIIKDRDKIGAS